MSERAAWPHPALLVLTLTGCNAVLGLDGTRLEEEPSPASSSSALASSSSASSASTSGAGGDGGGSGGGNSSTGTGGGSSSASAGGGEGGAGGGDPCGPVGLLVNAGFECGVEPWSSPASAVRLDAVVGDAHEGEAFLRFAVPRSTVPIAQDVAVDATSDTCLDVSFAARSGDGSGQIAPVLYETGQGRYFLAIRRSMSEAWTAFDAIPCRLPIATPIDVPGQIAFEISDFAAGPLEVDLDAVVARLIPCAGSEQECVEQ